MSFAPKHRALWGSIALLAVTLLAFGEILVNPAGTGFGDYQFFHHTWELGRVAIGRYRELPLWNPYQCGGIPEWGDPQSQLFHPLFFLSFLLGTTLALKLFILAHAAAGFAGMYRFCRTEEALERAPSALSSVVFASSGFFAWHVGVGHGGFVAFYLTPWVLLAFRRSVADVRWAGVVALAFLLALLAGGVYAFPYFALLIAVDGLRLLAASKHRRALVVALLAAALSALLVSAIRLVPVIEHLAWYPRVRDHKDASSLLELLGFLTHFDRASDFGLVAGHPWSRVEYGSYVGVPVLLLACAAALSDIRRRLALVIPLVVFGSLCLGDFASYAPWSLLRRLPVFSSLQVPTRFAFAVVFFLATLSGHGVAFLVERGARAFGAARASRWLALAPIGFSLAAGLPILAEHRAVLAGRWNGPVIVDQPARHYFLDGVPSGNALAKYPPRMFAPQQHLGTGWCYTGMGYGPAPSLRAGDVAQVELKPFGTVLGENRTITRATADVVLPIGGRAIFNQTFAPGWTTESGALSVDERRIAVDLPPGTHHVLLEYAPRSLPRAALTSLLGLVAIVLLWRFPARLLSPLGLGLGAALGIGGYAGAVSPGPTDPPERPKPLLQASASDYAERGLNVWYRPDNAVDDRDESEWLAPPGRKAWLELRLDAPLPLRYVVLQNAKNPPHGDYRSRRIVFESFLGPTPSARRELEFSDDLPLSVLLSGERVDRLRIQVETWEGVGGGIAEVRVF